MRHGEHLHDLDVGGGDEALGHGVERGDVESAHARPPVALVALDHPQLLVLLHPDRALAGHWKENMKKSYILAIYK